MNLSMPYHISKEQMTEEQGIIEAAKRNRAMFEPLYKKYFEQIYRFVFRRVNDKEVACDITQQSFINAMVNLGSYEFRGTPFSSWLYRITMNEMNKWFRENKADRFLSIENSGISEIAAEMSEGGIEEKDIEKMGEMMTHLEDREIMMIEMRFFEKRSFKEIGDIMEISENNAKVRMYRLLDKMRALMMNGGAK